MTSRYFWCTNNKSTNDPLDSEKVKLYHTNVLHGLTFNKCIYSYNEKGKLEDEFTVDKGSKPGWRVNHHGVLELCTVPCFQFYNLDKKLIYI